MTSVFFLFESSQGVREGVTALQQFALQVEGQERVEGEQEKLAVQLCSYELLPDVGPSPLVSHLLTRPHQYCCHS